MKFLQTTKDGGPESTVWAHWLIEIKGLFSIVLLRFEDGSRDAYHEHAFDCVSWVLKGELREHSLLFRETETGSRFFGAISRIYRRSLRPIITRRETLHKVTSHGRTWVLSFRGPWAKTWREWLPSERRFVTLTHGRKEVVS